MRDDQNEKQSPTGADSGPDPLERHKGAVAAIVVNDMLAGTGYLVSPRHVATCRHVVRTAAPGATITLYFEEGEVTGVVDRTHETLDAVLIKLADTAQIAAAPLALSDSDPPVDADFRAFGFPAIGTDRRAEAPSMRSIVGSVRDPRGKDTLGRKALQLYSDDIAAGRGALPQGFSGSAVVVAGAVVGHLNTIVLAPDASATKTDSLRAELGAVDACPVSAIRELLGSIAGTAPAAHTAPVTLWSVPSEEQKEAIDELLRPGGLVTVCAPPGHGKKLFIEDLLVDLRERLSGESKSLQVHRIDFLPHVVLEQGSANAQLKKTLTAMAAHLVSASGGNVTEAEKAMSGRGTPDANFRRVLERMVLDASKDVEILVMMHFDQAVRTSYQNSLYGMFRSMAVTRTGPLSKLRMIVATVTSPSELIMSLTAGSHWGVGRTVFLGELSADQIERLATKNGAGWTRPFIDAAVLPSVGGHPWFVRRLIEQGPSADKLVKDDDALFRLFLPDLRDLLLRLAATPAADESCTLQDVVIAFLTSDEAPDEVSQERLRAMGVLADDPTAVRFRYPIFERFLRKKWLQK